MSAAGRSGGAAEISIVLTPPGDAPDPDMQTYEIIYEEYLKTYICPMEMPVL